MVQTGFQDALPRGLELGFGVLVEECLHPLHSFVAMVKGEEPILGREGVGGRMFSRWGLVECEGLGEVEARDLVDERVVVVRYDVVEFSVDEMEVCEEASTEGDLGNDFEDEFCWQGIHCFRSFRVITTAAWEGKEMGLPMWCRGNV